MALQNSGSISLANLQSEFGGSNPIGMNEYYRGSIGTWNTSVPSSGTISLSQFYGASATAPVTTQGPQFSASPPYYMVHQSSNAGSKNAGVYYGTNSSTGNINARGGSWYFNGTNINAPHSQYPIANSGGWYYFIKTNTAGGSYFYQHSEFNYYQDPGGAHIYYSHNYRICRSTGSSRPSGY